MKILIKNAYQSIREETAIDIEVEAVIPQGWHRETKGLVNKGDMCFWPFNEDGVYDKDADQWAVVDDGADGFGDVGMDMTKECFYAIIRKD